MKQQAPCPKCNRTWSLRKIATRLRLVYADSAGAVLERFGEQDSLKERSVIVLHLAPMYWEIIAGPNFSVPRLIAAQNRLHNVHAGLVVTCSNPGKQPEDIEFPLFDYRPLLRGGSSLDLPAPFDRPDACVFHSTYIPAHERIAKRLRSLRIPYFICPRGGMAKYAQSVKPLKKWLGNQLFFGRLVAGATAIQCVSDGEASVTNQWNRPMFVAGNGVDLPPPDLVATPGSGTTRRLLCLGRLHTQIKGLDLLVDACAKIRSELVDSGTVVNLYGPDSANSQAGLIRDIRRLGLDQTVQICGPVRGDAKAAVFASHDAFLQPSRTEGHSLAALEALGAGLPCLLTRAGHMADEVEAAGAGWAIETSVEGIAAGLLHLLRVPVAELRRVGQNSRKLAAERFSWRRSATLSVDAYRKYLASGPIRRAA